MGGPAFFISGPAHDAAGGGEEMAALVLDDATEDITVQGNDASVLVNITDSGEVLIVVRYYGDPDEGGYHRLKSYRAEVDADATGEELVIEVFGSNET
jgi:hypothetical protein